MVAATNPPPLTRMKFRRSTFCSFRVPASCLRDGRSVPSEMVRVASRRLCAIARIPSAPLSARPGAPVTTGGCKPAPRERPLAASPIKRSARADRSGRSMRAIACRNAAGHSSHEASQWCPERGSSFDRFHRHRCVALRAIPEVHRRPASAPHSPLCQSRSTCSKEHGHVTPSSIFTRFRRNMVFGNPGDCVPGPVARAHGPDKRTCGNAGASQPRSRHPLACCIDRARSIRAGRFERQFSNP